MMQAVSCSGLTVYFDRNSGIRSSGTTVHFRKNKQIIITSLLSQGGTEPQLKVHINGALNVGLSQEEILETFIQCIPYVGFPKILNAVDSAKNGYN